MKKSILKKIGGLFLGLTMGLGVTVGVASGGKANEVKATSATSSSVAPTGFSWSHTMVSGDLPITATNTKKWTYDNLEVTWNLTSGNTSAYVGFQSGKGVQLGSGSSGKAMTKDYTISTAVSSFGDDVTITKFAIGLCCASGGGYSGTLPNGDTISGSSTTLSYYVSGDCSIINGNITFTFKSTQAKALYVHSIYIWFNEPESTKVLESITVSGDLNNKTYVKGSKFNPDGLTATAKYTDLDTGDITNKVEWIFDPETASSGLSSISVVAKLDDISSEPFTINGITVEVISTVTFDATKDMGSATGTGQEGTITKSGISLFCSSTNNSDGVQYRFYSGSTVKITSTIGNISKIEFSGNTKDSISNMKDATVGTLVTDAQNNKSTWTGSANEVSFTMTAQGRAYEIVVTLESNNPSIELNPKQILCQTGESSKTITATTSNFSGTVSYDWSIKTGSDDGIISFTNSNTASLSVSISKKGNTILVCTATSGNQTASAECQFTITQAVTSIQFVNSDTPITSLTTYDSFSYKDLPSISILPADANQNYTWNVTTGNDVINKRSETQYNILKTGTAIITAVSTGDTSKTCTLTITVENDTIDNIRVKSGSIPKIQYVGTTFNSTGLEFERHWYHADKWNVCDKSLLTFDDKTLTLNDTSVAVTYTGTTVSINISITVLETPSTYTVTINSNRTTYIKVDKDNLKQNLSILDNSQTDLNELIEINSMTNLSLGSQSGENDPKCLDRICLGKDSGTKVEGNLTFSVASGYYVSNISLKAFNNASKDTLPTTLSINNNSHSATNKSTEYTFGEYLYNNQVSITTSGRLWIYDIVVTFEKASAAAETYATRFNAANVCGTDNYTAANATIWAKQAAYFTNADEAVQNAIKNGTANISGTTQLEKCLAKYDRAVYRATLSDRNNSSQINNFMGRAIISGSRTNPVISLNEVDNSIWIISTVALVGLTAIGGYFFYRKRKENI